MTILEGPMATLDHRDRLAPNGIYIIAPGRPPSSCKNQTWADLLGNRAVSFQLPLPRRFWLHPAILEASLSTRQGRLRSRSA